MATKQTHAHTYTRMRKRATHTHIYIYYIHRAKDANTSRCNNTDKPLCYVSECAQIQAHHVPPWRPLLTSVTTKNNIYVTSRRSPPRRNAPPPWECAYNTCMPVYERTEHKQRPTSVINTADTALRHTLSQLPQRIRPVIPPRS